MLSPPPRPLSFLLLIHLLHLLLTPPPLLPSPFSHSCYQIKCQTEREGGWMAHISSYRGRPVYCCTLQSVPCYSFLRSAPTPPAHPKPGSLAADWVVIVIKSSCTASEYTKLSANGWSSVGGWPGDGGGFVGGVGLGVAVVIVHTLSAHCLRSSLYYHRPRPCTRERTREDNHCNTPAAF